MDADSDPGASSSAFSIRARRQSGCVEAFYLQRTRFELIVERKIRRRQLTDDGNVEITRTRSPGKGLARWPEGYRLVCLVMPGNSKAIIAAAERQFPVRIVIKIPANGIGTRYKPMTDWLDENCGVGGWSITPAGTRGVLNDAFAVYMNGPTCAVAFVARWCVAGDPPGFYELRHDEPARRVPIAGHSSPPRRG